MFDNLGCDGIDPNIDSSSSMKEVLNDFISILLFDYMTDRSNDALSGARMNEKCDRRTKARGRSIFDLTES